MTPYQIQQPIFHHDFRRPALVLLSGEVVDSGCFFVLGGMDILLGGFLQAWTSAVAPTIDLVKRLRHLLFHSPAQLSEWNITCASIYIGFICAFGQGTAGGRDLFVSAAELITGFSTPHLQHIHIEGPAATTALSIYGFSLMTVGILSLICILQRRSHKEYLPSRSWPEVREVLWYAMQVIWTWTAGVFLLIHWFTPSWVTPVTGYVTQLALTSRALHRRVLLEDSRQDE